MLRLCPKCGCKLSSAGQCENKRCVIHWNPIEEDKNSSNTARESKHY